ncbi:MAG: TIGR03790 family protein [Opitutales bacterium]|nr:TIGR03790 family protein [Opitutales bacterium]
MKKHLAAIFSLCASVAGAAELADSAKADLASRVFVVAAANDADSVELAEYYMSRRGIPAENLIAFPMPKAETLSWDDFAEELHAPLLHELCRRGLVDGTLGEKRDVAGRLLLELPADFKPANARAGMRIAYLVLCRGVPLRIQNDASKLPPLPPAKEGAPAPKRAPLETNCASVDSELALIAAPGLPVNGAVPNPFFKDSKQSELKSLFLKVARLDGITLADAKALVDGALNAEKKGLMGRAYIDIGGPHKQGDGWLAKAEKVVRGLGFDTSVESSKKLMAATSRYDAPALYFGWYTQNVGGFFLDPNFRFPAGACAIHIHSFSATSMLSTTAWTPALVARGVTATVGNVYEPYLGLSHHPHYFAEALAAGMSAGDAAAFANPAFSWQTIFVGDPLYRPFKKSLDAQLAEAKTGFPSRLHQYAFLRAANLAREAKNDDEADKILNSARFYAPGVALEYAIARNNFSKTYRLDWKYKPGNLVLENPGLLLEIVRFWAEYGKAEDAVKYYGELLARRFVPEHVRAAVLTEAIACAEKHHVPSAPVRTWREELLRLSPKQ